MMRKRCFILQKCVVLHRINFSHHGEFDFTIWQSDFKLLILLINIFGLI